MDERRFNTNAIHAGRSGYQPDSMTIPIYQTVAYPYEDAREAAQIFRGEKPGFTYGRWDNPTVQSFEQRMAVLEHTESAIATSSGMSAIFMLAHHLLDKGDEFLSSNLVYGGTFGLFQKGLDRMGANVNWITSPQNIEAWESNITPRTKFLFVESPSNPNLFIADLPELAKLAKKHGLPLIVDNTICTPALQNPVDLGADIVVHSTTKYICGNASALGGIICGPRELVEGIRQGCIRYIGASLSPFNAWLNLIGLEHLSLRMERHCHNAMILARYLDEHPSVSSVNYPGLASNPYHKVYQKQMKGCSSLMSFEVKGSYEDAVRVIDAFKLLVHATHLGTCMTIVTHPASTTHSAMGEEELLKAGISPVLIRVSVGLEDEADIIADMEQALQKLN
ncbi:MAG: aminotransferase class I/II-fold pyridoxal phosphate-dependent enzyme [Candidatus Aegiribacteria sp.]|nr:aminotransferase class I/II-fold pyridoxal phosphate-dependent enzyme [Candidatus Aegiribacteria sp.]